MVWLLFMKVEWKVFLEIVLIFLLDKINIVQ